MRALLVPAMYFGLIVLGIVSQQVFDDKAHVHAFQLLDIRFSRGGVTGSKRVSFFNKDAGDGHSKKKKKPTTDRHEPLPIVSPPTRRFALIYGTEEGGVLESSSSSTSSTESQGKLPLNVFETVSSQLSTSTLTRLGCAFAPPPHDTILPKMVESAALVSIDSTKMEIALAIPSDDEGNFGGVTSAALVQILVPVLFPSTLQSSLSQQRQQQQDDASLVEISTLLLETIQELDDQAMQVIVDIERKLEHEHNNHEEIADEQRLLQELRQEPYPDELPNWWTWPELRIGLEDECRSMKGLLNEDDFASDLRSLCRIHGNEEKSDTGNLKVVQACVAAVGPSGLFLRARVEEQAQVNGSDQSSNKKEYNRVDVGIAFPKEATSEDSLREAIVDLVESVEDMVEEPTIAHSETALLGSGTDEQEEEKPELPIPLEKESVEEASMAHEDKSVDVDEDEESEEESLAVEEIQPSTPKENPTADDIAKARQQPKSPERQAKLASKYAAIEDVGERAYTILKDLYMI